MKNTNVCILSGFLVRDPEFKITKTGTEISVFSVAVNDDYKKNNEIVNRVYFFDCEAWGPIADITQKYLKRGDRILINGKTVQDRWEHDGKTKTKIKIVVNSLELPQKKNISEKNEIIETSSIMINNSLDDDLPF